MYVDINVENVSKFCNMNVVLLLTACIVPNCKEQLYISDPDERKAQYIDALNFYLCNTDYDLVFVENSGTDISCFFPDFKKRIEWITYKGVITDRSRSYAEMDIIEYAYNISKYLKTADVICKITGRLQLLNIVELTNYFQELPKNGFISSYKSINKEASESKYIWFSWNFLPFLIKEKEEIGWDYIFETALSVAIQNARKQGFKFIYPKMFPREHGIGMYKGRVYDTSDYQYIVSNIKHQIKRVFFRIGIFPLR